MLGAVLLAAGSASRMGHRPKALLQLGGVPLVRRLLLALHAVGADPRVLVLGHHASVIEAAVLDLDLIRMHNPDPDQGQSTSLHCGLAALPPGLDAVLVALVDQPLIDVAELRALIDAYRQRPPGTEAVQPQVDGQPGNPVIFSPAACAAIRQGGPAMGGRQWMQAHPTRVWRWPTSNPHYVMDVDTPEDLQVLAQRTGIWLQWPES